MSNRTVEVFAEGFSYLEGPRWHDGRLYVSDFYTHRWLAFSADGTATELASVPGQPSGSGWLPDGTPLLVSMVDRTVLRLGPDGPRVHADLSSSAPWHLNDMLVDGAGRAWVGNFGFDLMNGAPINKTVLHRIDPDGTIVVAAEDLAFPNGVAVTSHGGTLIVAESLGQCLTAFDIGADGALSNRRPWAVFGETPDTTDALEALGGAAVVPDGIAIDAEDAVWVADAIGGRAVRVREGGEIVDEVASGGLGVFAVALGGAAGDTLYLCAAPGFSEHERRDTRDAKILATTVDVPRGAGLP